VPKAENGGASEEDRYSMAFFCHPAHKTPLEGVPSRRVQEREGWEGQKEQRGQGVITAEEHLMNKLRASYKEVDFSKA
jgi:isopenicillin N synthase-like dioxygenase